MLYNKIELNNILKIKKNKLWCNIILMILLLGMSFEAHASMPSTVSETLPSRLLFYFENNSSLLMRDYYTNHTNLERLDEILSDPDFASGVDSIVISGGASLIGSFQVNSHLSFERAIALRTYIRWKHPGVYNNRIIVLPAVFDWGVLINLLENDPLVPNRDEVLRVLNSDASDQLKVTRIKQLGVGSTEAYITKNYAKYMRTATSVIFACKEEPTEIQEPEVIVAQADSVPTVAEEIVAAHEEVITSPEQIPETMPLTVLPQLKASKPLFALKTNLLFDLASALNVEVEVPLGNRFSLAGEWIFPWWLYEKKQYALEILNGNLELRYWLGNRTKENLLTGWFVGIYGGAGLYDVEWKDKGYQGEFIIPFGMSGGFAHKISRNLRMEYSLGIGYMTNKYREYVPQKCGVDGKWHLIKQGEGKNTWIGPTRAKVSLVWMINCENNKK